MGLPKIHVSPTPAEVAAEASRRILKAAKESIALAERFTLCLAGGSTPRMLYEHLAREHRLDMDWTRTEIYFGDERPVGPDDPQSNYRMAREALLDRVPIPPDNVHRIKGELDPQQAATEYGRLLKNHFEDGATFDVCLLGMGDDGHTASLFPHSPALKETRQLCVANPVEKLGQTRLTLTTAALNRSHEVLLLVTGAGKAERVTQVLEEQGDPTDMPVRMISPASGKLIWLMDAAAAGMGID